MADKNREAAFSVEGLHYKTNERISVEILDGRIASIQTGPENDGEDLPLLGPGLVDLQLNGAFGFDFNAPIADGLIREITNKLWAEGVTSYLPTIVTNGDEQIEQLMAAVAKACAEDDAVNRTVAGIHLEGPFISPEDGARGAHDKNFVKAPDWPLLQKWQEASGGRIKIATVAPEWPDSCAFISSCVEAGITVSIGHTAANHKQIQDAVMAGATMSTHLGNGAHLMLPRHPNYIWDQLAEDKLWAGIIADGFHIPESVLRVVHRVKGERAFLVSDAVYISGLQPGTYKTNDGIGAVFTPEGRLHMLENPNMLYGSAQLIKWGIEHLVQRRICEPAEAWEMASLHPAKSIRLSSGAGLSIGAPADLVLFVWEGERIKIKRTYKQGRLMFETN